MSIRDQQVGLFVPTTQVWDAAQLNEVDVTSPEFKELLVRLYQNINNIAVALNLKDSAFYHTEEFVNGQVFFSNPALTSASSVTPTLRQVYRKVINFGALPNLGITKAVPHGITLNQNVTFTRIYGAASDPVGQEYIPLPYASSVAANGVELMLDGNDVLITAQSNRTAFTICYVIIEFLKS